MDAFDLNPVVVDWFETSVGPPSPVQRLAWPLIASGQHALVAAPTGSGKTLAAFLVALNRLMFGTPPEGVGVRVLYISPLKALGVDVERNLERPLRGIREAAEATGAECRRPSVGIRSGDTSASERRRLQRNPPDILITTPESFYLLLTSSQAVHLATVEAVIVDEIHAVSGTKRGTHLVVSLERLEEIRKTRTDVGTLQRIGLSATQRPLEETATLLGGADVVGADAIPVPRPVAIVEVSAESPIDVAIELPQARHETPTPDPPPSDEKVDPATVAPVWPLIHARLVELIRSHRSVLIFVNNRRLAERLAAAVNGVADEPLALAHHGSLSQDARRDIEDRLKRGELRALVATSSLELGIDMGAIDYVVQIGAPPTIASGIQRIGRACHQVGGAPSGAIIPLHRGDLLVATAAATHIAERAVEPTYYLKNPIDVLAQQIVAIVAGGPLSADDTFTVVRRAAPFFDLDRDTFDKVLDLLSGRYPSDEFSDLRPRIDWDRQQDILSPRRGSRLLAVLNGGTIPDRGLYSVTLETESEGVGRRVGELDEEMVFETRVGEVFVLGASSWLVVRITQDRVVVRPAPGVPGKMPFWRGESIGRSRELGRRVGRLIEEIAGASNTVDGETHAALIDKYRLDPSAATGLISYVRDQVDATGKPPSHRRVVIESCRDEIGDWRVIALSPWGLRIHAPWALAVAAKLRRESGLEVDVVWNDDGMVFRFPESESPPPESHFLLDPDVVRDATARHLGDTPLFAARFRENAARALLLPRRTPRRRTPLWLQRRRAADLLGVVARFPDFPILLETYRECINDEFDVPGLRQILHDIQIGEIEVHAVQTEAPSPFASSVMFSYSTNFIYETNAPVAERRAQSLVLDQDRLRELLGDEELRELLDPAVIEEVECELQFLDPSRQARTEEEIRDLFIRVGHLSFAELRRRVSSEIDDHQLQRWLGDFQNRQDVIPIDGDDQLWGAIQDAGRFRDALGVELPADVPPAYCEPVPEPVVDLVSRFARTHGPFTALDVLAALRITESQLSDALRVLTSRNRVVQGAFRKGVTDNEWCDRHVLRRIKRRSLQKIRRQIQPVSREVLAPFLAGWQRVARGGTRRGLDGVLDTLEQLQGYTLPLNDWESAVLPSRVTDYHSGLLDELCLAGEVVWQADGKAIGNEPRVRLYLADFAANLSIEPEPVEGDLAVSIRTLLDERGALFLDQIAEFIGGFPPDVLQVVWGMVWAGELTNDTLASMRSKSKNVLRESGYRRSKTRFRSRRIAGAAASTGRWRLLSRLDSSPTDRVTAVVQQLLERYGVVTRQVAMAESIPGGFSAVYPVLKALEDSGRVRRGYFLAEMGPAQFALPNAAEELRRAVVPEEADAPAIVLAATDPANPFGMLVPWPAREETRFQRAPHARVVLWNGRLLGYLRPDKQALETSGDEVDESESARLAEALAANVKPGQPLRIAKIDGRDAGQSRMAAPLRAAGFSPSGDGLIHRGLHDEKGDSTTH